MTSHDVHRYSSFLLCTRCYSSAANKSAVLLSYCLLIFCRYSSMLFTACYSKVENTSTSFSVSVLTGFTVRRNTRSKSTLFGQTSRALRVPTVIVYIKPTFLFCSDRLRRLVHVRDCSGHTSDGTQSAGNWQQFRRNRENRFDKPA